VFLKPEVKAPAPRPAPAKPAAAKSAPPRVDAPAPKPAPTSVAVGVKVKVIDGPFAGKLGTVLALDGKGGAKVNFGLLSAHMALGELSPVTG
jgi:transcription antitermination factor NusG